ncbi:ethylene-responsive transcription factor ERF109-like [Bidens hawaiensis]|uniref:ethylene-responsive transcription factor ERF109-like n=1 Tax=Bidens hawaiensis TaxID=980011 RepID=UPI00404A4465
MYNNRSTNNNNNVEHFAMVSALIHVIRGNNNPSDGIVIAASVDEHETCDGCGLTVPDECLGCELFTRGHEKIIYGTATADEEMRMKKYRGVGLKASGNWGAEIMIPGKVRKWLGTFETAEEAARANDRANIRYRGKNAKTNFPVENYPEIRPEDPLSGPALRKQKKKFEPLAKFF